MSNYGHLSRQLYEVRGRIAASTAAFGDFGTLDFLIPEINRLERIVNALESIGVNLDESDIEALEGMSKLPDSDDNRSMVKTYVNAATYEFQIESREDEQARAIEALTSAGFVLNDEDGETWTRNNETVKIELANGRESRYKWEYERAPTPGVMGWIAGENYFGVSGEFHRLLKLIAPVASDSPCATTEVSRGK